MTSTYATSTLAGGGERLESTPPLQHTGVPHGALLSGYVGSLVVSALDELGALAGLRCAESVSFASLVERIGAQPDRLRALLRVAESLGYVASCRGQLSLTDAGRAVHDDSGYFLVTTRGFSRVFERLAELTRADNPLHDAESLRDDAAVAVACARVHRTRQAPILNRLLSGITYRGVLDIGCGAGSRLIELVSARPGAIGIGVDVSAEACSLARENVALRGLGDRISVIEGDAREVLASPPQQLRSAVIDFATCFFLLHHFFDSAGGARGVLASLRDALPALQNVLIADHIGLPEGTDAQALPIFSLEFELFHAFIGVQLRSLGDYRDAFAGAGFELLRTVEFGHPQEFVFHASPA